MDSAFEEMFGPLGSSSDTYLKGVITTGRWQSQNAPKQEWLMEPWLPKYRATLLTGDGGTGKSLFAQQLATAAALGAPMMGVPVNRQNAIYITCEDDLDELHRRQEGINKALCATMDDLNNRLFMLSRVTEYDNSLVDFSADKIKDARFFNDILHACLAEKITFVVLDNIAHLFSGNENIRQQVAIFCNAMERLADRINGTVLFLGHPAKSGAQFSGSTAWENQVRSRLFLERADQSDMSFDPNSRVLSRSKANYAAAGGQIKMHWQDWAFYPENDHRIEYRQDMERVRVHNSENERFLKCLEAATEQRRPVSASRHAQNYAPKAFAKMTTGKGLKQAAFEGAMERLFHLQQIEEGDLWKGSDRKPKRGLRLKENLRDGCGEVITENPNNAGKPSGTVENDGLRDGCGKVQHNSHQGIEYTGDNVAGQRCEVFDRSGAVQSPPPIGGEGDCIRSRTDRGGE